MYEDYANTFSRTWSDKQWQSNKDYLLKHASDDMKSELTGWFEGVNYAKDLNVKMRSINISETGNTAEVMYLAQYNENNTQYMMMGILSFTDGKLVQFSIETLEPGELVI